MTNEVTHYRTIPESEYQKLKELAEGNQMVIEEIYNNSDFGKELNEIRKEIRNSKDIIKTFLFWFDNILDVLKEDNNSSIKFQIRRILALKEKL